jgi:hypothetical protein
LEVEVDPELIVKVRLPLVPPLSTGLVTVMLAVPAVARSAEEILALRLVALVKVLGRAVPFQFTTAPETKLLPETTIVVAAEPAVADAGEIEVRVGAGLLEPV